MARKRNLFCKHTQTSKLHSVLIVRLDRVYFSVYISVLYVTNQKGIEREREGKGKKINLIF